MEFCKQLQQEGLLDVFLFRIDIYEKLGLLTGC